MKKRTQIRLISFSAAIMMVLGGFVYTGYRKAGHYQWLLESDFQRSFGDLTESMEQISTTLQKGRYATSPGMMASLANEVSRQSALASSALSGLPFSEVELDNTSKFLSQVGDYSFMISKKQASGTVLTQDERKNLIGMSDTAYQLSSSLNDLYNRIFNEGNLNIGEALLSDTPDQKIGQVAESISDIETQFPEYAGLIYDGPFSDHIEKRQPIMLLNQPTISVEDAIKHVADTFGVDPSNVSHEGDGNGTIPVYSLSAATNGGRLYADVTKVGGYIVDMMDNRIIPESKLSADECINKAIAFMKKIGINNMVANYYISRNNVFTVNFAFTENDVTYYPDLIKVSVAQDNGTIVGFECRGYLMSHGDRTLPKIKVTKDAAMSNVADGLTVESARLAVIPSMGQNELYCHELKCIDPYGQRYLIYVNVDTGVEEQILILVTEENGVLSV